MCMIDRIRAWVRAGERPVFETDKDSDSYRVIQIGR